MKLKAIILAAACLVSGIAAQGQNKYSNKEGWYARVNAGVNVPFMESNIGKTAGAAVTATAGKDLTTVWGVCGRLEAETSKLPNVNDSYEVDRLFVAATFNLINAIQGYIVGEEGRFNIIGFAGPGVSLSRKFNHTNNCYSAMSVIAGGELTYGLTRYIALDFELSGIINGDKLNSIAGGGKVEGSMNVLAGIRCNF